MTLYLLSIQYNKTARRRAQKRGLSRNSCLETKIRQTPKHRQIRCVFAWVRILKKHVFQKKPGKRPDGERKKRGQVENRVLKKNTRDTKTEANTGFFHTGPDFEKHVFQENPGKRPHGERKKGVKSKIVF